MPRKSKRPGRAGRPPEEPGKSKPARLVWSAISKKPEVEWRQRDVVKALRHGESNLSEGTAKSTAHRGLKSLLLAGKVIASSPLAFQVAERSWPLYHSLRRAIDSAAKEIGRVTAQQNPSHQDVKNAYGELETTEVILDAFKKEGEERIAEAWERRAPEPEPPIRLVPPIEKSGYFCHLCKRNLEPETGGNEALRHLKSYHHLSPDAIEELPIVAQMAQQELRRFRHHGYDESGYVGTDREFAYAPGAKERLNRGFAEWYTGREEVFARYLRQVFDGTLEHWREMRELHGIQALSAEPVFTEKDVEDAIAVWELMKSLVRTKDGEPAFPPPSVSSPVRKRAGKEPAGSKRRSLFERRPLTPKERRAIEQEVRKALRAAREELMRERENGTDYSRPTGKADFRGDATVSENARSAHAVYKAKSQKHQ